MNRILNVLVLSSLFFLSSCDPPKQQTTGPNVILIFIDDLGYGDLGITGASGYNTPNIDKMARGGMLFTQFYSAQAVCSASRAGLLTGCYPNRIGITGALNHSANHGLNESETTIAEVLKPLGYSTGIFGKWHLGHHEKFLPLQHGFDEFAGLPYSNDMWPVDYDGKPHTGRKARYPQLPFIVGNEPIKYIKTLEDQNQLTSDYSEYALDFIDRNSDSPFFLYLAHSMVHVPLGVSDQFRGKSGQGLFGDVMMEIDWGIGQIHQSLEEKGLLENTLILFTSDNGPWLNYGNHAGSTAGFREGKGTSWEGGQRVPAFAYWPGTISPGTSNNIAATLDVLPTIASLTGAKMPDRIIDGVDLSALLLGDSTANPRDHLYFYYNRNDLEAVRKDQWKLVLPHSFRSYEGVLPGNDGWPGPYGKGKTLLALYDLRRDPGERYDVQNLYPEVVADLMKLADKARQDLGDNLTGVEGKNVRTPGWVGEAPVQRVLKDSHLAQNKKVFYSLLPDEKYDTGKDYGLVDGNLGSINDLSKNWQGWQGVDFNLKIDLGQVQSIKTLDISALQNHASWIFAPEYIEISISADNDTFTTIDRVSNPLDNTAVPKIINHSFDINRNARYLNIEIKSIKTCPEWHLAAGEKAWIFLDEIIVR